MLYTRGSNLYVSDSILALNLYLNKSHYELRLCSVKADLYLPGLSRPQAKLLRLHRQLAAALAISVNKCLKLDTPSNLSLVLELNLLVLGLSDGDELEVDEWLELDVGGGAGGVD